MASIATAKGRNGKTVYRVRIRLKGQPLQSAVFERLTDARRWIQDVESAIREGRHFKTSQAKRHTITELIDRYVREVLPEKPKSLKKQAMQLEWWKSQIGHLLLSDVTPAVIGECREKLASGVIPHRGKRAPGTVNRYLAAVSHVFSTAVKEWGWMDDSPMRKVRKLKEPGGRVRFLSDEERVRLLAECKVSRSPVLYPIVVLALSTGARQMEILSLTYKQVDVKRGLIFLEDTKNGERRSLPLKGHALDLMQELIKVHRLDTDLLFPGKDKRKTVDIRDAWEHALKRAEINDFRFHDLRHSCASYLAMNGATPKDIAAVLGHKTLQMAMRYSHLSEQYTGELVAAMNAKIFRNDQ